MKKFMLRFLANRGAAAGLVLLLLVILTGVLASVFYEDSPWMMVAQPLLAPFADPAYPLGTDMLGRDIAAGLAHGARVSLMIGIISTLVAVIVGVVVGALSGYYGGRVDDVLMRGTEFFQTIPQLAMAMVLVAIFKPCLLYTSDAADE